MAAEQSKFPVSFLVSLVCIGLTISALAVVAPKQVIPAAATILGLMIVIAVPKALKIMIGYDRRISICDNIRNLETLNDQGWAAAESQRYETRSQGILARRQWEVDTVDDSKTTDPKRQLTRVAH